jgi:hypothetical protein
MTAQQPQHLRVSSRDRCEIFRMLELPVSTNIVAADIERWVMDEEDCGPMRVLRERLFQPSLPRFAEDALSFALRYGIEGDQPDGMIFDGVVKERAASR